MKKKQITLERLSLDKETIARLNETQLGHIAGGGGSYSCKNDEQEDNEQLAMDSCCGTSCNSHPC